MTWGGVCARQSGGGVPAVQGGRLPRRGDQAGLPYGGLRRQPRRQPRRHETIGRGRGRDEGARGSGDPAARALVPRDGDGSEAEERVALPLARRPGGGAARQAERGRLRPRRVRGRAEPTAAAVGGRQDRRVLERAPLGPRAQAPLLQLLGAAARADERGARRREAAVPAGATTVTTYAEAARPIRTAPPPTAATPTERAELLKQLWPDHVFHI